MLSRQEKKMLDAIVVASENDPQHPEFPPNNPKFPATPTHKIQVPGFKNVRLKDESYNPTGTHKDRMAWEIVVTYRDFLLAKKAGKIKGELPQMSIISSGSAAIAIQSMLRRYGLPPLKVLMDIHTSPFILQAVKSSGCELYEIDLSKRAYNRKDILDLTNNLDGFDITSSDALDPSTRFYDWLAYEILNSNADYVFLPFGTGALYENLLNRVKREATSKYPDTRYQGNIKKTTSCHYLGATTNNPKTQAVKLYSPHLPFVRYNEQWIRMYRYSGFCGALSDVYLLQESFLEEAIAVANKNHIECEPSGIAGLALLLQMKNVIPKDKKILIVNTGKTKYL